MNKNTITAVVLTKNEEKNIGFCLASLAWADEIIVVDNGSSDGTLLIAGEYGAKTITHMAAEFQYFDQRNWVLRNVPLKGEWVLFMDADEVVPQQLAEAIRNSVDKAEEKIIGFFLAPKFIFMGKWLKHVSMFPVWHPRLLRKGSLYYRGAYYLEEFDLGNAKGDIGRIEVPYLHYGFRNGLNRWIGKHNDYSDGVAREILDPSGQLKQTGKRRLENWGGKHLFLGPVTRVLFLLFIKKGILDGKAGITYSLMMGMYQFMIGLKVEELKSKGEKT